MYSEPTNVNVIIIQGCPADAPLTSRKNSFKTSPCCITASAVRVQDTAKAQSGNKKHVSGAMKISRGSSSARQRGLSMEPRYVASRAYAKRRTEVINERLARAGLTTKKEASKAQLRRWDCVARKAAQKIHAEIMENSRTPSLG